MRSLGRGGTRVRAGWLTAAQRRAESAAARFAAAAAAAMAAAAAIVEPAGLEAWAGEATAPRWRRLGSRLSLGSAAPSEASPQRGGAGQGRSFRGRGLGRLYKACAAQEAGTVQRSWCAFSSFSSASGERLGWTY